MNERVIFDAALEIADAEARLAFIEKACVGNPAMLEAVKSLLKSHDAAGSFLDIPVREQIGQANPEDSAAAAEKTRLYRPDNAAPEDSDDEIDDESQPDLSFLQASGQTLLASAQPARELLDAFLQNLPAVLKPGGRVAVITFHSGEDRRVKKAFKAGFNEGLYSEIATEVTRPSMQEQSANPRSSSAKLRYAVRARDGVS